MLTARLNVLGLLLLLLALGACAQDTAVPTPIPPPRTHAPTERGTAVAQTAPTATPIATPEITGSTVPSTITPSPTFTPSLTPTPEFYNLPAWVSDPIANVLLIQTTNMRGLNKAATLFNAETGERFDMPVAEYISPKWVQTEGGLYIDLGYPVSSNDPLLTVHEIHVLTGQVTQLEIPRLLTPGVRDFPSPNGRYVVRVVEDENTPTITTLIDHETNEETELPDLFNGEYANGIDVAWSPDGQIVGIERYGQVEDPTRNYGVRAVPALVVFSLEGNLLAQYEDINRGLIWSLTPPYRLLYPAYSLNNEPPCILDVSTGNYGCVETVAQWRDKQGVEIGIFKWSPDDSKIGFVYWGGNDNGSGFCYVELTSHIITCPITRDNLQEEEYLKGFAMSDGVAYLNIVDYQWSPDGQYIAMAVNPCPPTCDDYTLATLAVTEISGEHLRVVIDGKLPLYNPWRPPIHAQAEE